MSERLFTPGPVEVPPEALLAESRPLIHHRTPEFRAELARALEGLRYVFQTDDPVLMFGCSGTGAMEAAVVNLVGPGDTVAVARGGKFGDRWLALAKVCGAKAVDIPVEWGRPTDVAAVRAALQANPGVKVLFATHSETSTGVRNDVRELAAAAREAGALFVVDGITSLGAMELKVKDWGVDVAVGGSQKGFMIAPGLAFLSVSARARETAAKCPTPRFYFDFARNLKACESGDTAFTPPISLVRSLLVTLDRMRAEGIENIWARHARNAAATRAAMVALGLEIYPQVPSDALTTVVAPAGITSDALIKAVLGRHGMRMANGQDQLKGKVFRIGHLGVYCPADILAVVGAIEDSLLSLGHAAPGGAGLKAAQKVLTAGGTGIAS
ncbi:MAG: alanine--glyoxylate aminotransferase family protein [Candidatus Eisenbacteria bacterium]|nr:alanine--glyoxylate aminotransferase family protein [Candidatus Eisenbacteria bacterium]